MFEISVKTQFAAGHALRLADGSLEAFHGHNWHLTLTVAAEQLDEIETVMDFHQLQALVEQIVGPWRNANLNDTQTFGPDGVNPSTERVAEQIGQRIRPSLPDRVSLTQVCVTEAPGCSATYRPPD